MCSKFSDKVKDGEEFCRLMNFPISTMQTPTLSKESDCFNGSSSVGAKYKRLDIDYDLINNRDYPDTEEDKAEYEIHPMDWEYIDENGEDVFDRLGFNLFGGAGLVSTIARTMVLPSISASRKFYRGYLRDIFDYIIVVFAILLSLELFYRRRIHESICFCCFGKASDQDSEDDEEDEDVMRE